MLDALRAVAPGKPLREGLDRILQANKGALIVVGDGPEVLNICSGGFLLDAAFSPQRLSELAKMDGAIILANDASRIARANVHLVPNPNTPTSETGTRHRTAERVARSINVPVISVSEDMAVIAVYVNDEKHPLEPTARLLNRANQALSTLERYRNRLDEVSGALSALEIENVVTLGNVVSVLQRAERGKIAAFAGVKVGLCVVEAHRASRRRREFRALIDEEAGNPVRPMKRREHQDALRTDDLPASFSTAPQALLQGSGIIRPDGFGDGGALTRRPRLQHLLQPEPCQACQKGDGRDGLNSEYDGQPPPPFTAPAEEIDQPRQQVARPDEQDSERQTEVGEKAAAVVLQDQRPTAKQASGHEECGEAQEPEVASFSRCTTSHGPGHDSFDGASSKRKEPLPCDGEVDLWPFLGQRSER